MSPLESSPDPPERSSKRRRISDPDTPQYGSAHDANLSYAYDDDLASDAENALQTPDHTSDDEATTSKRRRVERPRRLHYVPHMTLRGHKRHVAAVKFSPDGKWIASCCKSCRYALAGDKTDHVT